MQRRTFIVAATATTAGLAGCAGVLDSGSDDEENGDDASDAEDEATDPDGGGDTGGSDEGGDGSAEDGSDETDDADDGDDTAADDGDTSEDGDDAASPPPSGSPEQVVHDQAAALEADDLQAVQATYHPDSEEYPVDGTLDGLQYQTARVDGTQTVTESDDSATVRADLTIHIVFDDGEELEDSYTSEFEMVSYEGEWRVMSSQEVTQE